MNTALKTYFKENSGVLTTSQLNCSGLCYGQIQSLLAKGKIEQLRRGYYRIIDENYYTDIPIIIRLFPDAVLCLESALNYYGYIDRTPSVWHVAVKSTSARTRFNVECINIKPHFITASKYPIGITEAKIDGFNIKIYDRERTICDVLSSKNKMDAETYSQAVQNYLKDAKHDISALIKYAPKLQVETKVREILLPWV